MENRHNWYNQPGGNREWTGGGGGVGIFHGMPKPGPAVGGLLIANLVIFVLQKIIPEHTLTLWFAVVPAEWWQVWRLVTFQFLHGNFMHLFFNMLGLYFLGNYLEQGWGTKRFLRFYLVCGAIAGITHVLFAGPFDKYVPLVGASGGVYAVIIACAVLYPSIRIIILFFPVPIRFAALMFVLISVLGMTEGGVVSHAAHLGGLAAGFVWVWGLPKFRQVSHDMQEDRKQGRWERKMQEQQEFESRVDAVLNKIKTQGLDSLTRKEKNLLEEATERQRKEDQRIHRL